MTIEGSPTLLACLLALSMVVVSAPGALAGSMPSPGTGSDSWYTATYTDDGFQERTTTPITCPAASCSTPVALPFAFPFHGSYHTHVFVSSNGLVSFGTGDASSTSSAQGLIDRAAIAVLWDELGGVTSYQVTPERATFQWTSEQLIVGPVHEAEVTLFANGTIDIRFGSLFTFEDPIVELADTSLDPVVGISAGDGQDHMIAYDGDTPSKGTGVRFEHAGLEPLATVETTRQVDPGCQGLDSLCYQAGARAEHAPVDGLGGQTVGQSSQDEVDAGALPARTPPVPAGGPVVGPDEDGDGLPASLSLPMQTVAVAEDGTVSTAPAEPVIVAVDPDDQDPVGPGTDPDGDGDGVPDLAEPELCAQENPFFASDGSCEEGDYTPPGPGAPGQDLGKLLPV